MEKSHFVHLHTHSHFSHEDGVPSPQELAREAAFNAEQARIDALIANMRLDAERQQQMLYDQLNQALFPAPVY